MTICCMGCNPFPEEDTHPEVPYLSELIKNPNVLQKIEIDSVFRNEMQFLKSDKILLQPNFDSDEVILIDANKKVFFKRKHDLELPFYIGKNGDIYCNNIKYYYPDYKKYLKCNIINIHKIIQNYKDKLDAVIPNNDSVVYSKVEKYTIRLLKNNKLQDKDSSLSKYGNLNYSQYPKFIQDSVLKFKKIVGDKYPEKDSIIGKKIIEYKKIIAQKYNIKNFNPVATEDYCEEQNGQLIFWKSTLFVNDFEKESLKFDNFDDKILVEWTKIGFPLPIYLYYYQLNDKQRFKDKNCSLISKVILHKKTYLYTNSYGLYLVKD
jgi:hypothetical protein